MNIFVVSYDLNKCARALDDKRLNKMMLETTQILCTLINLHEGEKVTPYRSCHVNHPIVKWAIDNRSKGAWCFLYRLGTAYGLEIQHRFNRKHASHLVLEGLTFRWPSLLDIIKGDIEFYNGARHMGRGLDFTHLPVRRAYRTYLNARWPEDVRPPKWTNRKPPKWYK